ncbi:hypothetical protein EJ02DRAFT_484297 [Clathrospora elynae]|uniref:Uncharacterized protein n=1 Tax=Clathrospora elynae TaxID=706981 RepID=A0A6A5S4J1_9PLEO|nr:hypothetical protein EJ02DRAFT_484297 [Clathrospora elynae]
MSNLAQVLESQGKYEDAESMNRQTLALKETVLGREHPSTLTSMSNLALVLGHQGKYEDAEAMNRQTLALSETVLGREHPSTLTSMNNLAHVLAKLYCYHESLALYERACAGCHIVFGEDHPTTQCMQQKNQCTPVLASATLDSNPMMQQQARVKGKNARKAGLPAQASLSSTSGALA